MVRTLFLLILAPLLLSAQERAEDSTLFDSRIEVGLGTSLLQVNGTLPLPGRSLSDGPGCGLFREGSGQLLGPRIGLHYQLGSAFGLFGSTGLDFGSTEMSFPCVEVADIRLPDGRVVPAQTEFVREEQSTDLMVQIGGSLQFYKGAFLESGLQWRMSVGMERSYAENIVTPQSASFVDGGAQSRPLGVGLDESAGGWAIEGILGLGYLLPAGERLSIVPRITGVMTFRTEHENEIRRAGVSIGLMAAYRFNLLPRSQSSPLEPGSD